MGARVAIGALVASALAAGCGGGGDRLVSGPPSLLLGAEATAFGRLGAGGAVTEVGLVLPIAAVDAGGAAASSVEVVVELPPELRGATFFDHVFISFSPLGHGPSGIYDVPHFDLHFFGLDAATRAAVVCPEAPVARVRVPEGYLVPATAEEPSGGCVAGQGLHALDLGSPELQGEPFTATMILVFHDGGLAALEPMLASSSLLARADVALEVPRPAELGRSARWPSTFTATYDREAAAYRLTFGGFGPIE